MFVWLRIVVSCFCLLLCVLFVLLWVRSFYYHDFVQVQAFATHTDLQSMPGRVFIEHVVFSKGQFSEPLNRWLVMKADLKKSTLPNTFGFACHYHTDEAALRHIRLQLPNWFLVLATSTLAFFVRPKPRLQFGIRELLVLITLAAITIGPISMILRTIRGNAIN